MLPWTGRSQSLKSILTKRCHSKLYRSAHLHQYFKMELHDCPPVPPNFPGCATTFDPDSCGPCNYASKTHCGTVARNNTWGNCTCDMSLCDEELNPWVEITDLDTFMHIQELHIFDVVNFRYYLEEGTAWCNKSILFRMGAFNGDPDIFVGDPVYGANTIASKAFQDYWPWTSYRSMGDSLHV